MRVLARARGGGRGPAHRERARHYRAAPSIRGPSGASARRWKHPVAGCFGRSGVLQWIWGCFRRGNRQWLRSREPAIAAGPSLGGEGWTDWAWKDQQAWQRALEQRQQRIIRARPIIADDAGASWPARMREMCSMRRTLRTGLARCHGGDRHADGGPPQWGSVGLRTGSGSAVGRHWTKTAQALRDPQPFLSGIDSTLTHAYREQGHGPPCRAVSLGSTCPRRARRPHRARGPRAPNRPHVPRR